MASRNEFDIIADFFRPLTQGDPQAFDLMDDAALIDVPQGCDLVVTKDALVAGVHFLEADPPERVGQKLLRVNLSDLAAKGARPLSYALACAWPRQIDERWIEQFARGLAADQGKFDVHLLGGDTVSTGGNMTLSLTAFGAVPSGKFVERRGAAPGDYLWVTGTIGDAALGLELLKGRRSLADPDLSTYLEDRYQLPEPRLTVGQGLTRFASACIDISDGLVADAGHIAARSSVQLAIGLDTVPFSEAARACGVDLKNLLGAGDDYELLFTASPTHTDDVLKLAAQTGISISLIGAVEEGEGVVVRDDSGATLSIGGTGYKHFD